MIRAEGISDMVSAAAITQPLTLEIMKAAIDKLEKENPFLGVREVKECTWLKGTETVVISGDTAYYWPDMFESKEVKVLRLPEFRPELDIMPFSF